MSGLENLKAFEARVDRAMEDLPLFRLPIRAPVTGMAFMLHGLLHGYSATNSPPKPEAANSFAGRMAYLMPLLSKCPADPLGANAKDCLEAWLNEEQKHGTATRFIAYAHFAELMPEVHRGYFDVSGDETKGFLLRHPSSKVSDAEAEDILLAELALACVRPLANDYSQAFDNLAKTAPILDVALSTEIQAALASDFEASLFEMPLVSDNGLIAAAEVDHSQFKRFRCAVFALSEFAIRLAQALGRLLVNEPENADVFNEMLEWVTICWDESAVINFLRTVGHLTDAQAERLLALFGLDFRKQNRLLRHAAEGFFPPFVRVPGVIIVVPDFVKMFMQTRNLLYAVERTNSRLFDSLVSGDLEPELLKTVVDMLQSFPTLHAKPNVVWASGEIDLLVYDAGTNSALHLQAKAPLPPQGARMVQRLESRIAEGLNQLRKVRELSQGERDRIIGEAIGSTVSNVSLRDVILARSCFGTHSVRADAQDVMLLTLPILSGALNDCKERGVSSLPDILEQCTANVNTLVTHAKPHWSHETVIIEGVNLSVPLFHFDTSFVQAFRDHVWRGRNDMSI